MVEQGLPRFARRPLDFARRLAAGMFGRGRCPAVTVAILYSLPFYGAMIVAQYLMLRAVGAEVGLLAVVLGAPLVSLVALTPITINGLFLAEGAFVLIYASSGVAAGGRLAAAIVRRLVDLANSGFGSFMWLAWHVGVRGSVAASADRPAGRYVPAVGGFDAGAWVIWKDGPSAAIRGGVRDAGTKTTPPSCRMLTFGAATAFAASASSGWSSMSAGSARTRERSAWSG